MSPLAIALQASLCGVAHAQQFDAHGPALPPDTALVDDPALSLGGAHTGAPTVTILSEAASTVLVQRLAQGDRFQDRAVVDDLFGANLGFQTGIYGPLGLGVSLPFWYLSNDGLVDGGVALGDATLWVPLGLVDAGPLELGAAPFLGLPTGSAQRFLGEGGVSGGLLATGKLRVGPLLAATDIGLDGTPQSGLPEWPGGPHFRSAGALGLIFAESVGVHAELRSRGPLAGTAPSWPIEAMGTLKVAPIPRLVVTGSAGSAVTRGVGASAFHMLLGVIWAPGAGEDVETALVAPPEFESVHIVDDRRFPIMGATVTSGGLSAVTDLEGYASLPPRVLKDGTLRVDHPHYRVEEVVLDGKTEAYEVELARKPVDLAVSVVGPEGALMLVEVSLDGPYEPGPARVDEAGVHHWELDPGSWFVRMSSPGLGSQERTILIEKARVEPIRVDAVLASELDGDSRVRVEVVDRLGRPVEDAVVALSDRDLGTTGTGGDVLVEGLGGGSHDLVVRSERFGENARVSLVVVEDGDEQTVQAVVDWRPGSVQVVATNAQGQPIDATVNFVGPSNLPARGVGSDGDEVFTMRPGTWDVEVSAPGMGTQRRTIEVTDEGGDLVVVDVGLTGDEGGDSTLNVRLTEVDGAAAAGVDVFLDGERVGQTGPDGRVELQGLKAGKRTVTYGGGLTEQGERRVELTKEGSRIVDGTVRYADGVTVITVTDAKGSALNAKVAIDGPKAIAGGRVGLDGTETYTLGAGEWSFEVSADGMASQRRVVTIQEGSGKPVELGFALVPEGKAATVAVNVVGPDGEVVEGATVSLDGQDVGRSDGSAALVAEGVAAGRVEVAAVAEGMRAAQVDVRVAEGEEAAVDVALEWAPGAMQVDVRGPDGEPVEARVTLRAIDGSAAVTPRVVDGETVIGAAPGTYEMVVEADGLRTQVVPVSLGEDAELTVVPVAMEARAEGSGAALLVKAEDESGRALVNAEVAVDGVVVGRTSASGTLEVEELGPGRVEIVITPESGVLHEQTTAVVAVGRRDEKNDQEVSAALVVEDAARDIGVVVTDSVGNAVPAEILAVQGKDGGDAVELASGETGTLALKPGSYTITARAEDGSLATTDLVVPRLEDAQDTSQAYIPGMDPSGRSADGVAEVSGGGGMAMLSLRVEQINATVSEGTIVPVNPILFDTGRHVLRSDAQPLIRDLALWLQANREAALVEVGGHTDSVGGVAVNQQLSERRARSVVAALIELGVAPERLQARGFGLSRPVTSNVDATSRQRNRRVDLVVLDWIE